ncbi:MAG: hypothetical protein QF689_14645 [Candidatus Latescibacteria bacterium]|nr:hypothetical protein [Candidatus Latescibacterota bacterium]HJP29582.1 hypothetical protein [Candidatus Latescibacterota bacterium]
MIAVLAQQAKGSYVDFGSSQTTSGSTYVFLGAFIGVVVLMLIVQALVRRRQSPGSNGRNGRRRPSKKRRLKQQKDALSEFTAPVLDIDPLINPPTGRPRPIPDELQAGTVLVSQRLGVKCLLIDQLVEVGRRTLKEVCARKLRPNQAIYLPMGTQLYKEEVLHQGRGFAAKLRKGSLFLSVGGHPNAYLLDDLQLPLRRELSSNPQILAVTETTAQKYLQALLDIPPSFELLKEDVLFDASAENVRKVDKGSLVISRSGALVGLMLEDYNLPHKGPLSDLEALFQLRTQYERFPIETLIQRSAKAGSRAIPIERGTFIFSSAGKVYFVWKEGLEVDEATLTTWSRESQIWDPHMVEVSKTKGNQIGGPGLVVTQDDLTYLRDVFRQAGTTRINIETLLLDKNVFYKFMTELPYAHTGKFRHLLGKTVFQLNSASRGTFSIELGGKDVEITDLDLKAVREHLLAEGKLLIKIGTRMRIKDERFGDWIYAAHTNLFYPYETFTRPYHSPGLIWKSSSLSRSATNVVRRRSRSSSGPRRNRCWVMSAPPVNLSATSSPSSTTPSSAKSPRPPSSSTVPCSTGRTASTASTKKSSTAHTKSPKRSRTATFNRLRQTGRSLPSSRMASRKKRCPTSWKRKPTSRICPSTPMLFASLGAFRLRWTVMAVLLAVTGLSASPVRVATLGGDRRLLLDSTNLFDYPALLRQLAHVDIELFDHWAGIAVPITAQHGVALFLNRPDDGLDELSTYLTGTGSPLLRSLEPRPWLDAMYALQLRRGLSVGVGLRYAYDVRDLGDDEASVSRWDSRIGIAVGAGHRRLEGTLRLERVALSDRAAGVSLDESDGNGFGIDLRGRWWLGADAILLPSVLWRRSAFGLAPQQHEEEELRGSIALNVRPAPTVLGVLGISVAGHWQRSDVPGDGLGATEHRRWLLPAIVTGGEVQVGSLQLRLGARHESVVEEVEGPAGVDLSFDAGLVTDIGLGFEFGDLAVDGMLEKNFLRDGPHFIGGSSRGGGLLTTLSFVYRLYP